MVTESVVANLFLETECRLRGRDVLPKNLFTKRVMKVKWGWRSAGERLWLQYRREDGRTCTEKHERATSKNTRESVRLIVSTTGDVEQSGEEWRRVVILRGNE